MTAMASNINADGGSSYSFDESFSRAEGERERSLDRVIGKVVSQIDVIVILINARAIVERDEENLACLEAFVNGSESSES